MATMAANATSTSAMHYSSDLVNMTESSMELTKRFAQMQLAKSASCIPKRQPTIVCEDIADDDDLIDDDEGDNNKEQTSAKNESLLLRSASSASLTVPVVYEDEVSEKRRPPLPSAIDH